MAAVLCTFTKFSKAELRIFPGCCPKLPQVLVENTNMLKQ